MSELFDPPADHIGTFGWVCGYSADAAFMNDAAERFTLRTRRRRMIDGDVALALLLDRGTPRLSTTEVPGVLHLAAPSKAPFELLHSKVALLGFRHLYTTGSWRVRLVVSTGNWTRQTLEESLDLAWQAEVCSDELSADTSAEARTDIAAATSFMTWLRRKSPVLPIEAVTPATAENYKRLDAWCKLVADASPLRGTARFIDNRRQPLLPQIVNRVEPGRRNVLVMGSGFYESGGSGKLPKVPADIVYQLKAKGIQNADTEVDLIVNPMACQAIATARAAIAAEGWTIRRPGRGPFGNSARSLHAKFLFGAHRHHNSNACLRAWLYLGSGNLTPPGLVLTGARANLEAGVVFAPKNLVWAEAEGLDWIAVERVLPLNFDDETEIILAKDLLAGGDMPERLPAYLPPPVTYLRWTTEPDAIGRLVPPADACAEFEVLDPHGAPCQRDAATFVWQGDCPPEVQVRWTEGEETRTEAVCVVDRFGRIAAARLNPVTLDDVWSLLADFPLPPPDDGDGGGDGIDDDDPELSKGAKLTRVTGRGALPSRYPIRRVMELVERIAARQTALAEPDWILWCARLEQTLDQAKDDPEIVAFRTLGLDPLSPLRAAPFRPPFAETAATPSGARYEATLDRVANAWCVANGKLEP
ncbi:hypothetical protein ASE88_16905 [Sphingomonas sp. Leaf38]|nr:hypothetical protein ASE88_16905 [Sphingomonas sp. Leaf38]